MDPNAVAMQSAAAGFSAITGLIELALYAVVVVGL
jgi:hypothetical protein